MATRLAVTFIDGTCPECGEEDLCLPDSGDPIECTHCGIQLDNETYLELEDCDDSIDLPDKKGMEA